MRSVALLPSIALLCGASAGIVLEANVPWAPALLAGLWVAAAVAWLRRSPRLTVVALMAGYVLAGATLGASAAGRALDSPLRGVLDAAYGGFALETTGPGGPHPPTLTRARLVEDAASRELGVSLRAEVEALALDNAWRPASGGVRLTVSGALAGRLADAWRTGRVIEAPVTFRRPARYLNEGVPDFERALALDGVALVGSVKSGLVIRIVRHGNAVQEVAASLRARVRAAVERRVGVHAPVAGAIVTAILIGDRTALPDEVRERLQAAGTYHVIAISGGNIAILAALMAGLLSIAGTRGRRAALLVIAGLAAYALVVSAGPSVWRATTTAIVYLAARLFDHRSPPWNALAVSAAILVCASPLEVRDVGFALTFGATAAILEAARRARAVPSPASWIVGSLAASIATEIVLLPIAAAAFSRATVAGVALNLLAVPLMTVAQVAGLAAVALDRVDAIAGFAGIVAAAAARGLVESARLVEVLPWLALRVPPPPALLVAAYYAALAGSLGLRRGRCASIALLVTCGAAMVTGAAAWRPADPPPGRARLTVFDVGQGEAMLLQTAGGRSVMVDAGGAGFDGSAFDIGGRVLAPALWSRGIVRLGALAVTHADPDHIGGALAIVRDFAPAQIWQGIPVPAHPPSRALAAAGRAAGAAMVERLAGWRSAGEGLEIRVLHPSRPDWERLRVRNDDSLVIAARYGEVALLLTGDVSAEVERELVAGLPPARVRVLKVAHHGSRTSTSRALLEAWRPHVALVSCGRGNRFGHPAPEVIERLEAIGARIYRTDLHGQITLETDGKDIGIRTYLPAGR